jgi:hypothetical protein
LRRDTTVTHTTGTATSARMTTQPTAASVIGERYADLLLHTGPLTDPARSRWLQGTACDCTTVAASPTATVVQNYPVRIARLPSKRYRTGS